MSKIFVTEPSVYLLGRQQLVTEELNRFLEANGVSWTSDTGGSEALAETAGRVCYMSFAKPRPGGNAAYLDHIKESGHGSVLEHCVWNFVVEGISRSLSHEFVRHRAGFGYSQLSQRYVDESDTQFVVPSDLFEEVEAARDLAAISWGVPSYDAEECDCLLNGEDELSPEERAGLIWLRNMNRNRADYAFLTNHLARKAENRGLEKTEARKFARQAARSVLPNATETKIFVTVNGRALRHFFEQRGSRHAEPEIRRLAVVMLNVVREEAPNLFGDYEKTPLPDGTFEITTPHRKV